MKFKFLIIFLLFKFSLAHSECYTVDGIIFDCECCVNNYPYDQCYSKDYCSHFLAWFFSIWGALILIYICLYCYARYKFTERIKFIQDRARVAQAEKPPKQPGVLNTEYVETAGALQTLEVTKDYL